MVWFICISALSFLVGAGVIYFYLSPRLKHQEQINTEIIEANQKALAECEKISSQKDRLEIESNRLNDEIANKTKLVDEAAKSYYDKTMELTCQNIEQATLKLGRDYQDAMDSYETEYLNTLKELAEHIQAETTQKRVELLSLSNEVDSMRSIVSAAVEASKRAVEIENQKDFYRLVLSEEDILEIARLREVIPFLRQAEPLNKVIWKVYYEKPYTDLIGRVVGSGVHTGIYKITNLQNQMCYVGQAVNIADRWKQHIKRGVGADTPTRNKLYPAMMSVGVENFSFEIVEECDRALLDQREDYWQDYFKAKEFGYSIK